jgi:diguanylate cyclase (GGDEF)-like protein/PAS domain S-box-containing protein
MKKNTILQGPIRSDSILPTSLPKTDQEKILWLQSIVESSDDAILGTTTEGNIMSWNGSAERMYGYTAQEMIGQSMLRLIPSERFDEFPQIIAKIKNGERIAHLETVRVCKDGSMIDVSRSISPIKDKKGQIIGASVIARDITDKKRIQAEIMIATAELKKAAPKLWLAEKIFESANDGIVVTDIEGVIQMVNPSFLRTTGYGLEEVLGFTPRILRSGYHEDTFYRGIWEALAQSEEWSGEIWNKRKNGELYPEWLSISSIHNDRGQVIMYSAVCRDLSERLAYEDKIKHQAFHDGLTGLPNRLLFQDRLDQALALAKTKDTSVGVFFLDIDNFKKINDTLGHDIGDLLLQAVAQRLFLTIRSVDTVARMGGDEFTIILAHMDQKEEAIFLATKVLEVINTPFVFDEHTITITTSIGISLYPLHGQDRQTLMKQADIAMYVSKKSGKNKYCFYSETSN